MSINSTMASIPEEFVERIKWNKSLGLKLRKLREVQGLTRPELSKLLKEYSEFTIRDLENGYQKSTNIETVEMICNHLGAKASDLFY